MKNQYCISLQAFIAIKKTLYWRNMFRFIVFFRLLNCRNRYRNLQTPSLRQESRTQGTNLLTGAEWELWCSRHYYIYVFMLIPTLAAAFPFRKSISLQGNVFSVQMSCSLEVDNRLKNEVRQKVGYVYMDYCNDMNNAMHNNATVYTANAQFSITEVHTCMAATLFNFQRIGRVRSFATRFSRFW